MSSQFKCCDYVKQIMSLYTKCSKQSSYRTSKGVCGNRLNNYLIFGRKPISTESDSMPFVANQKYSICGNMQRCLDVFEASDDAPPVHESPLVDYDDQPVDEQPANEQPANNVSGGVAIQDGHIMITSMLDQILNS